MAGDSVVIAERDTLKEVTVITIDRNETGDTVRVSSVTDRTRASSRDRVKDVKVKVIERTDTVYIEHKDSVEVKVAAISHLTSTFFLNGFLRLYAQSSD